VKNFKFLMMSSFLMVSTGLASAQTTTPVPTAVNGAPSTRAEIKARIKGQIARINGDSKAGKLTTVQADSLLADLKTIREKVKADYAINGKKELTSDQKSELNNLLDQSDKNIGNRNGLQTFN